MTDRSAAREAAREFLRAYPKRAGLVLTHPLADLLLAWHRRGQEDMRERAATAIGKYRLGGYEQSAAEHIRSLPLGEGET